MSKLVLLFITAVTLGGCAHDRLDAAGNAIGTANAGVTLPDLPAACRQKFGHAQIRQGDEARTALIRERTALSSANATIKICAENYDTLRAAMAGKPEESRAAPPKP